MSVMSGVWKAFALMGIGIVAIVTGSFSAGYNMALLKYHTETVKLTCIEDTYEVISKPGCYLTAENVVSGTPDGESGWFKKFDQIGVCGIFACKGQEQGTYECFELNKLRKQ